MRRPSGDHAQPLTPPVRPERVERQAPDFRVPDPQRLVVRSGDDAPPVRRPRAALHPAVVAERVERQAPTPRPRSAASLSSDAETMRRPSGDHAQPRTTPVRPERRRDRLPTPRPRSAASSRQKRRRCAARPATTRSPSPSRHGRRGSMAGSRLTSQIRSVRSEEAETMRRPSGDHAQPFDPVGMA